MKKLLVVLLCVFAAGLTLVACASGDAPKRMEVYALPNQDFIVEDDDSVFLDSLKEGSVVIMDNNNIYSDPIPMTDPNLIVSGFSSKEPGQKVISIKHKNHSELYAEYTVNIAPVQVKSFDITTLPGEMNATEWVVRGYFADVELSDIDLSGGVFIQNNNDLSKSEPIAMTEENIEAVAIEHFSENDGAVLMARITVKIVGTSLVEKFNVPIAPVYPVSYQIKKQPTFRFYPETAEAKDINLSGLEFEVTRNSGKTYTVSASSSSLVEVVNVNIPERKISVSFKPLAAQVKSFDIVLLGRGVLVGNYSDNLNWETLEPIPAADAIEINEIFVEFAGYTKAQLDSYQEIKDYVTDIAKASFYDRVAEMLKKQAAINSADDAEKSQEPYKTLCAEFVEMYTVFATEYRSGFDGFKSLVLYVQTIADTDTQKNITIESVLGSLLTTNIFCKDVK